MKNIVKALAFSALGMIALSSCDTDIEARYPADLTHVNKSESYYAALREYKKTDHEVAFGWFGNWTGTGIKLENSLAGLPDSTDFVSLWGNWKNPSADQLRDLKFVQQKKGTKALICCLVFDIGDQITPPIPDDRKDLTWTEWRHEFWGWKDDDLQSQIAATEKYANAICDTIDKYNYDGFDIDAEPSYAQPFETKKELWKIPGVMSAFVKALSKRIGPKSGTGRMLVVDGEPDAFSPELGEYFDYFILQAYGERAFDRLDRRFARQIQHFESAMPREEIAKKIIVCENFESFASGGGVVFNLPDGKRVNSLTGFAMWKPEYGGKSYRKGGIGTYHMEYEFGNPTNVTYPYLRKAIQLMNPAVN